MNTRKETLKQILIAVLVGTCVTFITSLGEGLISWLHGVDNNIIGGMATTTTYIASKIRTFV